MRKSLKKYFFPLLIVTFFVVGMTAIILSINKTQNFRNKAVNFSGIGSVAIDPITASHYVGDLFPVTIKFNTGGASISSIALRLVYRFTGTTAPLVVSDQNGNPSNQIYPSSALLSTGNWTFPVKSVKTAGGAVTIDFSAINTSQAGYSTTGQTNLATIYFKVAHVDPTYDHISLAFDSTFSKMLTKASPAKDILNQPQVASYTLYQQPTSINFGLKMQGIGDSLLQKDIGVTIVDPQGNQQTTNGLLATAHGMNGLFTTVYPVSFTNLPNTPTIYTVYVKEPYHLRKRMGTLTLSNGSYALAPTSWNNEILLAADYNNDNTLDITDLAKWLSVYNQLEVPVTDSNKQYDVNGDGSIDLTDIALILANYTALEVPGD